MTRLRIVTINTGKGDGRYRRRMAWLAEELTRLAPDIVLLQEALRTADGALGTVATLADGLGMAAAFAPARRKNRLVEGERLDTWSGLGLLSRSAAFRTERLSLPDHPDDGERVALLGCWQPFDGVSLVIANVHLTHLRGQDALRARQFAALLAHPWLTGSAGITLVGGDLNTAPADLGPLRAVAGPRHLTDTYTAGGGEPGRVTVPVGRPDDPGARLDYLLVVGDDGTQAPGWSGARVVLDRPDPDGVYPSDHYGIMVDLHLPQGDEGSSEDERRD